MFLFFTIEIKPSQENSQSSPSQETTKDDSAAITDNPSSELPLPLEANENNTSTTSVSSTNKNNMHQISENSTLLFENSNDTPERAENVVENTSKKDISSNPPLMTPQSSTSD